jgi:tetratricopeptide (TPR) repeat protein
MNAKRLFIIMWIAAGMLIARPFMPAVVTADALAADDGGGRSVFAFGAGNRALGLGGAYAAIADDASALLWNPGGLGRIDRSELQVSQASYFGLGMDEQYASMVLPHWRWGIASLAFRRFAVGGIERRDDRNVLLDGELSNSETEFSIGYGRNVGDAWSVGAAVKIRRQSLAGYSGSGVGVDIGAIAHPLVTLYPNMRSARRLSVGVALRNAVEPGIRLVNDKVPDPLGVRFGAAYLIPFFQGRTLLAAVDLEKTAEMNTRVHAGLELAVHQLVTVRVGNNDGMLTAGTGIRWKNVTVDYTFEDNAIDMVHRVGASIMFGRTVEESRLAAMEAEENAIQAKLTAAFEQRQNDRIRELLLEADEARRQKDYNEELNILAVITALDPDYEDALSRQAYCYRELGGDLEAREDFASASFHYSKALALAPDDAIAREGYDRCRAQSDRLAARSLEIRREFEAAMDAFSANRLSEAREKFVNILRTAPDDKEAGAMLQRTLRAIDQRIVYLLQQANQMIDWEHFDEADGGLAEVALLDPKAAGLEQALVRLSAEKEKFARAQQQSEQENDHAGVDPEALSTGGQNAMPSAGKGKSLTEEQKREIEHLYKKGTAALSEGRSQEAMKYLELVWSMDPGYQRVSEHLKREYLMRGMEHFADGYLEEAVEFWENALRIDPSDRRVIGYLTRAREQIVRTRDILGQSK